MKKAWWGAGAVAMVLAGWAGTGVLVGMNAEDTLKSLATQPPGPAWRVSQVQHKRGLLQSTGVLSAVYSPSCAATPGADNSYSVQVSYTISHLPMPGGAARFQWQLTPQGETAEAFKTLFGSASALTGEGSASLTGAVQTDMRLPAVALRRSGEVLEVTPSTGLLHINGAQLAMDWKIDRAVARGDGQAYDVQGIELDLDLDDRRKGTGNGSFKIAQASASLGSLEGLELNVQAREQADRLNMSVTPSLRKIEGGGQVLTDLRMQWALNGLHSASVETLIQLFTDSCGLEALTAKESQTIAQALETLLIKGFSFGMPTLTGKAPQGSLEGSFVVELAAASGAQPSLAQQLHASGRLEVKGPIITPEQREMAVATGYAVVEGDRVTARFDYAKGLLKVNNRTMDASAFENALSQADESVRTALAELRDSSTVASASTPVPVEAEEAEEAEETEETEEAGTPSDATESPATPAPAGVPTNVPAGECASLDQCIQHTLSAARQNDLDGVRRVATQIDRLPKPDLGNKVVARKLNATALEALKQNDVAAAITLLSQARQENPQDVEIVSNLGFALVKSNDVATAQTVLKEAVLLNPRRTSTWTPLAEALALSGQMDSAKAALWVAFQWASNRDKSLAFYIDRSTQETRPALVQLYKHMANVAEAALAQEGKVAGQ